MNKSRPLFPTLILILGMLGLPAFMILVGLPTPTTHAAPTAVTVELTTTGDARTQAGSPDVNFGSGFLYFSTLNGHFVFTQFDMLTLPAEATIDSAALELSFTGVLTGPNDIEVGHTLGPWDESTLTWNNQPGITWGGPVQPVSVNGIYSWDVTSLVSQWHEGTVAAHGFALRGNGGGLLAAESKENGGTPPKLIITYTLPPPEGAYPDLGDAPDSSNHLGLNNTAYLVTGILGQFPTVWDVPAGQVAGPRHDNLTHEAILGDHVSREFEADTGADQDGQNNILDGGLDNANNDRGDDGWRNRNVRFFDCRKQTLTIRVTKSPTATLNYMYLNVWFDGNRDGDWADFAPCQPVPIGPAQASYEWIVQDHIIDLTAVPAGGFLDFQVDTERVLNQTGALPHWMRFTLSEERAAQPPGGAYPDGRGPHPSGALGSYRFGETEDVLQRPQPPGDDGTLILEKRVIVDEDPVSYAGTATYEIRLRHDGGTQPLAAQIRDELEYPLHLIRRISDNGDIILIEVTSPTGGAAPLQANLNYNHDDPASPANQVVFWEGTLEPNSEVELSFDVHVHPICGPDQQTETIHNIAQARPLDGDPIESEVTFFAACPGYDPDNVRFDWENMTNDILDLSDFNNVNVWATVSNLHPITATLVLTGELETSLPNLGIIPLPGSEQITLGPNETRQVQMRVPLSKYVSDELAMSEAFSAQGRLHYCFVVDGPYTFQDENPVCPDGQLFPNLVGQSEPFTLMVRPSDLGDAPDSTNHFAAAMAAYPGVQAAFPSVFDPAAGLPPGPKHLHPRPFHLGPQVSREAEADIGPDADPMNNIVPPANNPDNDRFDDGINPNLWALNDCQTSNIPVRVFISPQAVNWFQQQEEPAYLNLWLDANRDGDWADGFACGPNQSAVEHIVIDFPVDVIGLGAGLHVINVPTGLTPWPAALANQPFWTRITLSEHKSNKTLLFNGLSYGDGRGFATPFRTGETEDFLAYPQGAAGAGPDMVVHLTGEAQRGAEQLESDPMTHPATLMAGVVERVRFTIEYANIGNRSAAGARLTFGIPTELQGVQLELLEAPGILPGNITFTNEQISFLLPEHEQPDPIIIGWTLFPDNGSQTSSYTAVAEITLNDDIDPGNNQADTTVTPTLATPLVAARAADNQAWGGAETTCRSTIDLTGLANPGETVAIFVDEQLVGTTLLGEEPIYYFQLSNLGSGLHRIQARYESTAESGMLLAPPSDLTAMDGSTQIDVNPLLPIDPLSLTFTDSEGHRYHPATLGVFFGNEREDAFLEAGETYEVAVDSCASELNQSVKLYLEDSLVSDLRDEDGDGRYSGSFIYDPTAAAAASKGAANSSLRLDVFDGGTEQSFSLVTAPLVDSTLRDALTSQPLAGAAVTALGAAGSVGEGAFYSPWPEEALGRPNPQLTTVDGEYRFQVPGGLNRVEAIHTGYQTYRSWESSSANGALVQDIALTPEFPGTAVTTIYITKNGFQPALASVPAGRIVEWINLDLTGHTTKADNHWDSGTLAPGQSYRMRLDAAGSFSYGDEANPLNIGSIMVEENRIFLPFINN